MSDEWTLRSVAPIGDWLRAEAVRRGRGVTWYGYERIRGTRPFQGERRLQGSSLYRGSAGISLFLTELAWLTSREDLRELSRGALQYAVEEWKRLAGPRLSLFSGEVGTVFALACHLRHFEDAELREAGEELVAALVAGGEGLTDDFDLISGAAGAIIGLLGVTDIFDAQILESFCARLGEHLIAGAHVESVGLSWRSGGPRGGNLCGLAHGAGGIGWALLELHRRTRRSEFLVAAEEAFAYENGWFERGESNWADLRNSKLDEFVYQRRMDELDELVRAGGPVPLYEPKYMTAWCHGAPGIGMTRARAFELLGRDTYRSQVMAAVRSTADTLGSTSHNHSLCHGFMGNAFAQLRMARTIGLSDMARRLVERIRAVARSTAEGGGRWVPGGPIRTHPDPSLMLGEAGIGLTLLGLEHDVIAPLFAVPRHPSPAKSAGPADDGTVAERKILLRAFPETAAALGPERSSEVLALRPQDPPHPRTPTVTRLGKALRELAFADEPPNPIQGALEADLMALERGRRGFDQSNVVLCRRFPVLELDEESEVGLAPWVEIVRKSGRSWLLYPEEAGNWRARPLSPEIEALLEGCRGVTTTGDLTDALATAGACGAETIRPWVQAQMQALASAGILISGVLARAMNTTRDEDVRSEVPVAGDRTVQPGFDEEAQARRL